MSSAVRPELARDRAYAYAKTRILDGRFASGDLISEGDVANAVGVSRTPARDAFLRLEAEGLVRLYPKRGAVVVPISLHEIRAVLEARVAIETFVLQKLTALDQPDRSELAAELRLLLDAQDDAVQRDDDADFARADRAFHERLVAAAGNPILDQYYIALRDRQVRMNVVAFRRDRERMPRNRREHGLIIDAFAAGDTALVLDHLRQHVGAVGAVLGAQPYRSETSAHP